MRPETFDSTLSKNTFVCRSPPQMRCRLHHLKADKILDRYSAFVCLLACLLVRVKLPGSVV